MPHDIDLSRSTAWTRRYGNDAGAPQGPWNETIARLLGHRSVRAYARQAPPPGTLETLIAAAQSAATSSNLQTWSVIAVDDKDARAALAAIANDQAHVAQCPIFLVWLADLSRLQRLGTANGARLEGLDYLEMLLVAAIDAALAAQNAVVAAESLGLATVYIGALRNDVRRVAALLGLPPGAAPMFGLCIGYEAAGAALPIAEEVDITSCLRHFLKFGLLVICARALRNGLLEHRRLHNLNHVKKGLFGTNYPVEKDIYAGPYDLIIVPGLAFDQANNRLGYGGGYYDAFLSLHPEAYKVGVEYDFQRVPTVPVEEHDQHLDLVITNLFGK